MKNRKLKWSEQYLWTENTKIHKDNVGIKLIIILSLSILAVQRGFGITLIFHYHKSHVAQLKKNKTVKVVFVRKRNSFLLTPLKMYASIINCLLPTFCNKKLFVPNIMSGRAVAVKICMLWYNKWTDFHLVHPGILFHLQLQHLNMSLLHDSLQLYKRN